MLNVCEISYHLLEETVFLERVLLLYGHTSYKQDFLIALVIHLRMRNAAVQYLRLSCECHEGVNLKF